MYCSWWCWQLVYCKKQLWPNGYGNVILSSWPGFDASWHKTKIAPVLQKVLLFWWACWVLGWGVCAVRLLPLDLLQMSGAVHGMNYRLYLMYLVVTCKCHFTGSACQSVSWGFPRIHRWKLVSLTQAACFLVMLSALLPQWSWRACCQWICITESCSQILLPLLVLWNLARRHV